MPEAAVPAAEAAATRLLGHLERRVREEAKAAVSAAGFPATLAHIALATAYARRVGEEKRERGKPHRSSSGIG